MPAESWTRSWVSQRPDPGNGWLGAADVSKVPSPKDHRYAYGDVPPETSAAKLAFVEKGSVWSTRIDADTPVGGASTTPHHAWNRAGRLKSSTGTIGSVRSVDILADERLWLPQATASVAQVAFTVVIVRFTLAGVKGGTPTDVPARTTPPPGNAAPSNRANVSLNPERA